MQKTCPSGYVNPTFFDMAVTAFIKIQQRYFKFPEEATNYYGYWRIVDSFKSCVENATYFNFTTESDSCSSKEKPVSGVYCAFGNCSLEINMSGGFEDFDPIIETVWNVFENAHGVCFSHFNKNFNDHHRFTMSMIPLFQNQTNDIWRNGTANGLVYGGVFGNQENIQTAFSYCTAASRIQSSYPWDLPLPEKINELVKSGGNRMKRNVEENQPYKLDAAAQCLSYEQIHQYH